MRRRSILSGLAVTAAGVPSLANSASRADRLAARFESLRRRGRIRGMSSVITRQDQLEWSRGFGQIDAAGRPPTETTIYHLASLTKPFASTVLLQLVQEGKVSLEDPVSRYGIQIEKADQVRVRHLMSHTSEGEPGSRYSYNGQRYGLLDAVIRQASGKGFALALQERIILPLGLNHTAPNPQSPAFAASGKSRAEYEREMALGYSWTKTGFQPTAYPDYFGSAAGLTASALDMASFSAAMDRDALISPELKAEAYRPTVTLSGEILPYGLGWFTTRHRGDVVIWHYGLWTAISALIVKIPSKGLTLVVLANSDQLSAPYPLGAGRLEASPWARAFLDDYVS
jgi:CubicO group peptidase (beta-lactamase class C family)